MYIHTYVRMWPTILHAFRNNLFIIFRNGFRFRRRQRGTFYDIIVVAVIKSVGLRLRRVIKSPGIPKKRDHLYYHLSREANDQFNVKSGSCEIAIVSSYSSSKLLKHRSSGSREWASRDRLVMGLHTYIHTYWLVVQVVSDHWPTKHLRIDSKTTYSHENRI